MSIRDLFGGKKKVVKSTNFQSDFDSIESFHNLTEQIRKKNRVIPDVDYYTASNFAFFGSAEEYYRSSFYNISTRYPYDGSRKEITEFLNDSSYLDNFIFENYYPRYNGYAIISSNGWGTLNGTRKGTYYIGQPNTSEYILLKGGPHTASSGMEGIPLATTFSASNIYDTNIYETNNKLADGKVGTRETNLKTDFNNGITVEFWSKLNFSTDLTNLNQTQILFDLWNGYASGSTSYGRVIVGFSDANKSLRLEISSGSTTYSTFVSTYAGNIGDFSDTEMYADNGVWNHYAFVFVNKNSGVNASVYKNGVQRVNEQIIGSTLGEISGPLKATIGALQTAPSGSEYDGLSIGAGKMSGSIDEFKFWKSARNQEQIILYKNYQIGGGTNTDLANTELGVYYKFNEGITGTSSVDSRVLDYSGRISNGNWVGYPGSGARSTGSAIVESGVASKEYKDPVIYQNHPEYLLTLETLAKRGLIHDESNASLMRYNYPDWILEEDDNAGKELMKLNQIMSSEFDSLYLLVKNLYKHKENTPGNANPDISGKKSNPDNQRLLESFGLETDELFPYQTLLEYVQNRNMYSDYDVDITEVKNEIYKNIYNNLIYIYKSKGTEKSVRNMLRSLGINEEIIKLNAYSKNSTYVLEDKYSDDTYSKRYINFSTDDTYSATIFQSASSNPNTLGQNYITGSINKYQSFTNEVNVIFPKTTNEGIPSYYKREFTKSSIYGFHLVNGTGSFNWPSSNNNNIELYCIRPSKYTNEGYFLLTDREGSFELTTDVYKDVYNNSEWTFAVRFYNDKYPYASDYITGSNSGLNYKIDFVGYNTEGSYVRNQFKLTQDLNSSKAENMILSSKRYYAGAIRENFTGSVVYQSDIKLGFVRHYDLYLSDESIKIHSIDRRNFGVDFPHRPAFMLNGSSVLNNMEIGKIEFNNFNIDFETVTGSDSNGKFLALDFSSGSLDYSSRYPLIGPSLATQYEFTGYGFPSNSTNFINREMVLGAKLRNFENINSSDMVNVIERDDEIFTRDYDVESVIFALEKSYYGVISKEMLDFFGGIVAFNNLIGDVTEKYRDEYSRLRYLRNRFFERITDFSTFERFYSYFRWIDDSIANFVQQLLPESSVYTNNVRDIVESHILERNKVKHHYPYFDYHGNTRFIDPEIVGKIKSIKENKKNWRYASPPVISGSVSTNQNIHKDRWKYYQERNSSLVSSGIDIVDKQRENIRIVKNSTSNKLQDGLSYETGGVTVRYLRSQDDTPGTNSLSSYEVTFENGKTVINGGSNSVFQKNLRVFRDIIQRQYDANSGAIIGGTAKTSSVEFSNTKLFPEEDLELHTKNKKKYNEYKSTIVNQFDINKTSGVEQFSYSQNSEYNRQFLLKDDLEHHFPGTILSASVTEGPFAGKLANISNIHLDSTHDTLEVPMQGVFTAEHVGGLQYRHQGLNTSSATNATNRAEGFKIQLDTTNDRINIYSPQTDGTSTTTNVNTPFAVKTRDEFAKRPMNIRNIKYSTTTRLVGNYEKESDIVLLSGRTENNKSFVRAEGFSTSSIPSPAVSDFYDYTKPTRTFASGTVYEGKDSAISQHVIVNRFSAPGGPETAGDNLGGPGLDYEAGEYSPYNSLNYRNLSARSPLNRILLVDHMNLGGLTSYRSLSASYPYLMTLTTQSANTYLGLASWHKVNRNAKRVATQTSQNDFDATNSGSIKYIYNNPYIGWQVPGSDLQYSWIRKSYKTSEILDYQSKDGLVSSSSGYIDEITFLSSSDIVSINTFAKVNPALVPPSPAYTQIKGFALPGYQFTGSWENPDPSVFDQTSIPYVRNNISGLNTEFFEPIQKFGSEVGSLTLGYENSFILNASNTATELSSIISPLYITSTQIRLPLTYLSSLIHNRNGVYGHSVFKQIRVGDSKLGRYLRNNNVISFNERPGEVLSFAISGTNGQSPTLTFRRDYKITPTIFTEPVISNSTPPIKIAIYSKDTERMFSLKAEHGLELTYFTREDVNLKLNLSKKYGITAAETVFAFYKENENYKPIQLVYGESVYPNSSNRFLSLSRARKGYVNNFWKDILEDRQNLGIQHPTKYYIQTKNIVSGQRKVAGNPRSAWNLDYISEFETQDFSTQEIPSATTETYPANSVPGVLQNFKTYNKASNIAGSVTIHSASVIEIAPTYARPHFERWAKSVVSPWGMDIRLSDNTKIKDLNSVYNANSLLIGTGYAKWEANTQAGKYQFTSDSTTGQTIKTFVTEERNPSYDSYDSYSEDIRKVAKDMTVIPEYRVSRLTDRILDGADPAGITDFLTIPQTIDSGTFESREYAEITNQNESFYTVYSNSDFMKHFELVRQNNKDNLVNDTITLRCKAIKKFLPYDGFYPSERTAELADLFFKTYTGASIGASQGSVFNIATSGSDNSILTDKNGLRPVLQALFAPGILFNTIKSGVAVDYPIYTSSFSDTSSNEYPVNVTVDLIQKTSNQNFHTRIPFEAIWQPAKLLNGKTIRDSEIIRYSSFSPIVSNGSQIPFNIIRIDSAKKNYEFGINNFLAETERFFLNNGGPTKIRSVAENSIKPMESNSPYGMRIKMFRSLNRPQDNSGSWGDYPVPQIVYSGTDSTLEYYLLLNEYMFDGGAYRYDGPAGSVYSDSSYDSNLTSLTTQIVLSGANGQYSVSGNSAYTQTDVSFKIYTDTGIISSNYQNTARSIVSCINSGSSASEFKAEYLGIYQIPNSTGANQFTQTILGYPATTTGTDAITYGVVKITPIDTAIPVIPKISLSNSVGDGGAFTNSVINQFIVKADSLPTSITTEFTNQATYNGVLQDFEFLESRPIETLTMYSRPTAFGQSQQAVLSGDSATLRSGSVSIINGYNYGFTPPYYYGESWIDVVYLPPLSGNVSSFDSILNLKGYDKNFDTTSTSNALGGLYIKKWRFDKEAGSNPGTDLPMRDGNVNDNSMQLDASLDFLRIETDSDGNRYWSIQPKFETPVLNFNHLTSSNDLTYPTGPMSASVSRGMWHQFGRIPTENEGIYIQVSDLPLNWLNNHPDASILPRNLNQDYAIGYDSTGSYVGGYSYNGNTIRQLNDYLGFPTAPVKLGEIAQTKKIREAIIAVPFVEENGSRKFFQLEPLLVSNITNALTYVINNCSFMPRDYDELQAAINEVKSNSSALDAFKFLDNSAVSQLIQKMIFYNIPKQFDFMTENFKKVQNPTITSPVSEGIAMYLFEFTHSFSKDDLSYMWQGLLPDIGVNYEFAESSIVHPLLTSELLSPELSTDETKYVYSSIPEKVQWMVFKVKQKAEKDYNNVIDYANKRGKNFFDGIFLEELSNKEYGYNWPYDYFSLVEMAKIDVEVSMTPERTYTEKGTTIYTSAGDLTGIGKSLRENGTMIGKEAPTSLKNILKN